MSKEVIDNYGRTKFMSHPFRWCKRIHNHNHNKDGHLHFLQAQYLNECIYT